MEPPPPEKKPVRVTILHQPYTLLASDPQALQELADSVDQLMSAIAAKSPSADAQRVAVVACLHLADRLRTLEGELDELHRRVEEKSQRFRLILDQAIEDTEPPLSEPRP
jgi:cell division protein ZapA